jgi:prepilin-type N-terminal cleavage/methylation domain-containing protein
MMKRQQRHPHGGFTLIELIVIIAVLAVLAIALSPAIVQQLTNQRVDRTREEARSLYEAMVGRLDQPGNFGFAGDMGRLPQSFVDLVEPGGLPLYTTTTQGQVGIGWRGPYVNVGQSRTDYLADEFGRPYTGASAGQVRSAGPDGAAGTADDIVYPPSPPVFTGRVIVTVKTIVSNKTVVDPAGYDVTLYYSNGGTKAALSDSASPFVFDNVPMGLHHIQVIKRSNPQAGSIVARETVLTRGSGGTTPAELWF